MGEPVLVADNVRIDSGGAPVVEQLTVKTAGANVVVLGAPGVLFQSCAGLLDVTSGTLRIAGRSPRDGVRAGAIASAPSDGAFPARWTVQQLAHESARLAGHSKRETKHLAMAAIRALQLDALGRTRLGVAEPAVRRAAVLAAALATGAETIIVSDFTKGLPDGAARSLARLFVAACAKRRWILFAGQLSLSSPLGLHADEALLFAGARLVSAGPPAEIATRDRTYSLRTSGDAATFATQLRELGVVVEGADAHALTVTLPEALSTLELVTMARASKVVVLELLPVSGALV